MNEPEPESDACSRLDTPQSKPFKAHHMLDSAGKARVRTRGDRVLVCIPTKRGMGGLRPGRGRGKRAHCAGADLEVSDAQVPERAHELGVVARAEGSLQLPRQRILA